MSDTTLRVRQIGNYEPYATSAVASDLLLLQRQGPGGPYMAIEAANLVASALAGGQALGVGFVPPGDANSAIFTRAISYPLGSGPLWNAYPNGGMRSWMGGTAGRAQFDATGTYRIQNAPAAPAGGLLATWGDLMALNPAGALSLPRGTLTVARDPAFAGEVATMGWVGRNTVASFNGRIGRVQLNAEDVYCALGLDPCDPFMTASETDAAICAAIQQLLHTYPAVWSWNGRVGDVWLTTEDINWALAQGGIPPLVPTPGPDAPDNEAANIGWVRDYVAGVLAGPPAYATQDWVTQQLAAALTGTVASFNGRQGIVTLQLADVTGAGGAPLDSPNFTGYVAVPTANPGTSNAQAASTAFVMAAVSETTAGVASFNTRTGAVTLQSSDISNAGGALLGSPNFTGTPTAPTPNTGDSSTRIATTAFVMNEIAEMTAGVSSFNGREGAVTLALGDITGAGGAPLNNPALSGVPTAPTAANGTSTQQLATTAFVQNALGGIDSGVVSFNGRSGAITLTANDVTAAGGLANPSPNITGTPTAPTAAAGTSTTQLATTAFVQNALAQGAVTSFNARTGAITFQASDVTGVGGALLASPAFTGTPTAPTAVAGTNTTQLATTAFVLAQIAAGGFATTAQLAGYLPLSGGGLTGPLSISGPVGQNLLSVNGNVLLSGQVVAQNTITSDSTISVAAPYGANGLFVASVANVRQWQFGCANSGNYLIFDASAGAARLQIDTNGNFIIPNSVSVTGTVASGGISVATAAVNGNGVNYQQFAPNAIGFGWVGAASALQVYIDGQFVMNITPGASDPRLKTNISAPIADALDVVNQIKLQQFDLKGPWPGAVAEHWDMGFMADTLARQIPLAVIPGDGIKTFDTLNPIPIIAYLVGAFQALLGRLQIVEGKLA